MKGVIIIVLLTTFIIGCTAEQERAYMEKYAPVFRNETQSIVKDTTQQIIENISKQNEELRQQLENINKKLSSSESKGDGGGGGGIGENQTSPQKPPSDCGPYVNTTTPIGDVNESSDIYGDSKLAVLGDQQIDIRIKPVNYEVSVREEGDVKQKQFDEIFPQNSSSGNSTCEENIPPEQQELVKNYFNKLAGG